MAELRDLLVRGLGYALAGRQVREADLHDFAQEATLKILDNLRSYRGESRFITWALKVAIHHAFSELRRRRWRDVSLEQITDPERPGFLPEALVDASASPERQVMQQMALAALRRIIAKDLTDKQRQALVAVRIHGMPLEEVARRMGTNRNALYKLLHDARERLKARMAAEGLSPEEVLAVFQAE